MSLWEILCGKIIRANKVSCGVGTLSMAIELNKNPHLHFSLCLKCTVHSLLRNVRLLNSL